MHILWIFLALGLTRRACSQDVPGLSEPKSAGVSGLEETVDGISVAELDESPAFSVSSSPEEIPSENNGTKVFSGNGTTPEGAPDATPVGSGEAKPAVAALGFEETKAPVGNSEITKAPGGGGSGETKAPVGGSGEIKAPVGGSGEIKAPVGGSGDAKSPVNGVETKAPIAGNLEIKTPTPLNPESKTPITTNPEAKSSVAPATETKSTPASPNQQPPLIPTIVAKEAGTTNTSAPVVSNVDPTKTTNVTTAKSTPIAVPNNQPSINVSSIVQSAPVAKANNETRAPIVVVNGTKNSIFVTGGPLPPSASSSSNTSEAEAEQKSLPSIVRNPRVTILGYTGKPVHTFNLTEKQILYQMRVFWLEPENWRDRGFRPPNRIYDLFCWLSNDGTWVHDLLRQNFSAAIFTHSQWFAFPEAESEPKANLTVDCGLRAVNSGNKPSDWNFAQPAEIHEAPVFLRGFDNVNVRGWTPEEVTHLLKTGTEIRRRDTPLTNKLKSRSC